MRVKKRESNETGEKRELKNMFKNSANKTMKNKIFALSAVFCVLLFSLLSRAQTCVIPPAGLPAMIEDLRMDENAVLKAKVLEDYFKAKTSAKEGIVSRVSDIALEVCGKKPFFIDISAGHAGELWNRDIKKDEYALMEKRSFAWMNAGENTPKAGKWFASFGIQGMGGDNPSTTMNLRLGTMLYKNKYDLALTYDYNKQDYSLLTKKALGLSARRLFPLTPHTGWNAGLKVDITDYYGEAGTDFKGLAGINIYLPGGSFDITYSIGNKGYWSVILGYTVFITR